MAGEGREFSGVGKMKLYCKVLGKIDDMQEGIFKLYSIC